MVTSKAGINAEYLSRVIIGRGNSDGEMVKLMDTLSMYSTYRGLYGENAFSNLIKRSVKIDSKTVQEAYTLGNDIDLLKAEQKTSETLSKDLTEINDKVSKLENEVSKLTAEERNENQSRTDKEGFAKQRETKEKELVSLKENQLKLQETAEKVQGRDLKVELTQKQERYKELTKDFSMEGETLDVVTDYSGRKMIGISNSPELAMKLLSLNNVKYDEADFKSKEKENENNQKINHLRAERFKVVEATTVLEFLRVQKEIQRTSANDKMEKSITDKDFFALDFIEDVMKGIIIETKDMSEFKELANQFGDLSKALMDIKSKLNSKNHEGIDLDLDNTKAILIEASKRLSRSLYDPLSSSKEFITNKDMIKVLDEVLNQVFKGNANAEKLISKLRETFKLSIDGKLGEINKRFEKLLLEDLKREVLLKYEGMVIKEQNSKISEILSDGDKIGKELPEAINRSKYDRSIIGEKDLTKLCNDTIEQIIKKFGEGDKGILDILQNTSKDNAEFNELLKKAGIEEAKIEQVKQILSEVLVGKYGKETRAMSKDASELLNSCKRDGILDSDYKKLDSKDQEQWIKAEQEFWTELYDKALAFDKSKEGKSAIWKELFGEDGIGSYDRSTGKIALEDKVEVEGFLIKTLSDAIKESSDKIKEQNIADSKAGKVMSKETKLSMYALFDLGLLIENKHHLFGNQMLAAIKLIENGGLVTDMGGGKSFIGAAAGYMFNLSGFGSVRIVTPTENLAIRDAKGNERIFKRLGMEVSAIEQYMQTDEATLKEKMLGDNKVHYIAKSMPGFMKMDIQSRPMSKGEHVADKTFATIVDEADTLLETIARHEKQIIAQEAKNLLKDPIENALVTITAEFVRNLREGRVETRVIEKSEKLPSQQSSEIDFEFDPNSRQIVLTNGGREILKASVGDLKQEFFEFVRGNLDSKLTSEQRNKIKNIIDSEFTETAFARRVTNALTALKEMENHTTSWL
ncbi:MAG: Protein translocase subunit secA, partial [uncultured bacterium]